jgi:type II secretory pathway component PulK
VARNTLVVRADTAPEEMLAAVFLETCTSAQLQELGLARAPDHTT